jgi:soluble lytic murein transglycosylase-like protein
MKVLQFVLILSAIVFVGLSGVPSTRLNADPTDDLSLSLAHAPELEVYNVMSERKVSEVLVDQLDLFPKALAPRLARHLLSLCRHYRFDPAFILSLMRVESNFHVKVVSGAGAVGLMQVMPATARHIINEWDLPVSGNVDMKRALTDPFFNMTVGIAYLANLRDHYQGRSPYYLLAAYNVGPARMDELLSRKDFHPNQTLKYYESIRRGVPDFRYYRPAPKRRGLSARLDGMHGKFHKT